MTNNQREKMIKDAEKKARLKQNKLNYKLFKSGVSEEEIENYFSKL